MKSHKKSPKSKSLLPCLMMSLLVMMAIITLLIAFPVEKETGGVTSHVEQPKIMRLVSNASQLDRLSLPLSETYTSKPDVTIPVTLNEPKTSKVLSDSPLLHKSKDQKFSVHFIHVPKCGGTTMTTALRQVMCEVDPSRNRDCCINPGFCDHNANRRCSVIKGCINHFPNRPFIFRNMPTVTLIREPVSRLVSAWFYRGHNPNLDFFQVRPEFKEIKRKLRPKVVFQEYLEMPEYNNILTRMLGADSFPYRNVTINDEVYAQAVKAMDAIFFVGLQEAYELSVELMLRELGTSVKIPVKREREQGSKQLAADKKKLTTNTTLMDRAREVNSYDYKLYDLGRQRFCAALMKYPDLFANLPKDRVTC